MRNVYEEIGIRVRRHRRRLGWTQEELGERCRMHPSYIGQIERGIKRISIEALQRLSGALSLRMGDILEEPPPQSDPWESKIGGLLRDKPDEEQRVLYSTLRHLAREIRNKKGRRRSR